MAWSEKNYGPQWPPKTQTCQKEIDLTSATHYLTEDSSKARPALSITNAGFTTIEARLTTHAIISSSCPIFPRFEIYTKNSNPSRRTPLTPLPLPCSSGAFAKAAPSGRASSERGADFCRLLLPRSRNHFAPDNFGSCYVWFCRPSLRGPQS